MYRKRIICGITQEAVRDLVSLSLCGSKNKIRPFSDCLGACVMRRTQPWSLACFFALCFTLPCYAQRCGTERWSVKTGTDSGASGVGLSSPQPARISDLIALAPPHPLPADSLFNNTATT